MPLCIVLAPTGLSSESKAALMRELTEAIDEGYAGFVTEVYLRELPAENLMIAGVRASDNPEFNSHFKA